MTTLEDSSVARLERARHLGRELRDLLVSLATSFSGADAVLFIDRWTRCAAYPAEEQEAAELSPLVADGRSALEHSPKLLSEAAASGLELEALSRRITQLLGDEDAVEVEDVALDLLLVGSVLERLPRDAGLRARRVIDQALALMSGLPERFEAAAPIAVDRARLEAVEFQPPTVKELVIALAGTARASDEIAVAESLGWKTRGEVVSRALERWLDRQQPVSSPVDRRPKASVEFLWAMVGSVQSGAMLAADSHSVEQQHLSDISPSLFVVKLDGVATLEWVGDEAAPDLWRTQPREERLEATLVEGGRSWVLTPELAEAGLELRWGDGRCELLRP